MEKMRKTEMSGERAIKLILILSIGVDFALEQKNREIAQVFNEMCEFLEKSFYEPQPTFCNRLHREEQIQWQSTF